MSVQHHPVTASGRPAPLPDSRFTTAEHRAMTAALEAARRGVRGANPVVGAALLDPAGHILHVGHHRGAGTEHAEVDVLRRAAEAGTDPRGLTLLVTLEPCNHTGRTGPCSEAVLAAGVRDVVFAVADGTDAARGGGAWLRRHGVAVRSGLQAERARELNERWFRANEQRRPFVTLKIAQSLDGRVAAPDGTSMWLTGPRARAAGHTIRARVDAVVVGGGTVRADDPALTARTPGGAPVPRQPLRAVVARTPVPARAAVRRGVADIGRGPADGDDGRFVWLPTHDPLAALRSLADLGAGHVLVEGGPTLSSALLGADLVDELWLHQAPLVLGAGVDSLAPLPTRTLTDALHWRHDPVGGPPVRVLDDDVVWHLRPIRPSTKE